MAAHGVRVTQDRTQALCGELQHLVARRVAERVVDLLEVVEVHEQHCQSRTAPERRGDGALDAVDHQQPFGRVGQGVVLARARQLAQVAGGGFGNRLGMQRRDHEVFIGLEQLRRTHAGEVAPHPGHVVLQAHQFGPQQHRLLLKPSHGSDAGFGAARVGWRAHREAGQVAAVSAAVSAAVTAAVTAAGPQPGAFRSAGH